jgi:hypothetical protein
MSYEPEPDDIGRSDVLARSKVNVPGILLLVVGILTILAAAWTLVSAGIIMATPLDTFRVQQQQTQQMMKQMFPTLPAQEGQTPEQLKTTTMISYGVAGVIWLVVGLLNVFGGLRMRSLRGYGLAIFASILALLPCISPTGCCLLGQIAGIWALVVLMNQDVKAAFR